MFTPKLYRYCFAHSKTTFMYSGCTVKRLDADKERGNKMAFIEMIMIICLLAREFDRKLNTKELVRETVEIIKEFVALIMASFQMEVEEVPPKDEDLRGLAIVKMPEDILLNGKVQRVKPPTPEDERESYYPDMFSNQDSLGSFDDWPR